VIVLTHANASIAVGPDLRAFYVSGDNSILIEFSVALGGAHPMPNESKSGIVYAEPAGGLNCTDDTCADTGGCAKITIIRVDLPLDANIMKIRLRSAGPDRDQMHDNNPCDNIEWATWLRPVQGTTPNNKYVDAKFKNWSHNKKRKIEVIVEWEKPQ
jgi:hypothetical protein